MTSSSHQNEAQLAIRAHFTTKNYVRMTDYEMQRVMLTHMFMVFQEACRSFYLHVQSTFYLKAQYT